MKKKIFIIGSEGFLGQALSRYLMNIPSVDIFGIDRNIQNLSSRKIACALDQQRKLKKLLIEHNPEYIFNLAGGRMHSFKQLMSANFNGTQSLLDTVTSIDHYQPRIIIPGSAAEYGCIIGRSKKIKESFPLHPVSDYGFVKQMQTELGLMYARRGMNIVIGRIFNITGTATPDSLSAGHFAKQLILMEKNKTTPVLKTFSLNGKRDFLDVDDVASALWSIALKGKKGGTYNICSGKAVSIAEMLTQLIRLTNISNVTVLEDRRNFSNSFDVIGSNRRITQSTGWQPKISFKKSLKQTLAHYRSIL